MSSSRIWLIADSVLRTSSAISSYTTRAHGIIVKYHLPAIAPNVLDL